MGLQLIKIGEESLERIDLTPLLPPAMQTESPQTREKVLGELVHLERVHLERARAPAHRRFWFELMAGHQLQWWQRLEQLLREELRTEMTWEIKITFFLYTTCRRRLGSSLDNPYKNERTGFHITFYEKIESSGLQDSSHGLWKTGTLYRKPNTSSDKKDVQNFRQSGFSVLAIKSSPRPWKIWLLSHSDLVDWENTSSLRTSMETNELKIRLQNEKSGKIAELACIVWALRQVANRWTDLNDYIADLLSDNFMDPESYVKLLSDDAAFSRSKLYFWIIGCVNEFDISITENIRQWDLVKEQRYSPSEPASSNSWDPEENQQDLLLQEADELRGTLANLRSQFRNQLETAKSLRDGLFNASALIESRASTRLAGTVKLLTYVSLFYLPLAFVAALWAIPNITDHSTRNPFIITSVVVGFVTYAIIFNLENIAEFGSKLYRGRRTRLVDEMQSNEEPAYWRKRGERLEVFQPHDEHRMASEWWVVGYQMRRWAGQVKRWLEQRAGGGQVRKGLDQSDAGAHPDLPG